MNFNNITRLFGKVKLNVQKNSPTILTIVSITTGVAAVGYAIKKTLDVEPIINDIQSQVDVVKENEKKEQKDINETLIVSYSKEDAKKDLAKIYAKGAFKVLNHYKVVILLEAICVSSHIWSNNILKSRYLAASASASAMTVAYKELKEKYDEYREETKKVIGETKEKKIQDKLDERETEKPVDEVIKVNPHSFIFNEATSTYFRNNNEMNMSLIKSTELYWNKVLQTKGYVFVNDVRKSLGVELKKNGQIEGWVYDPDNPNLQNYISLGIDDALNRIVNRNFISGSDAECVITLNPDGNIFELLKD